MIFDKPFMEPNAKILIDNRESQERIQKVREFFGYHQTEVTQVLVGDYIYNNEVVVEYKTASDMVHSIMTNRIFKQVSRMRRDFEHHCLLVEGNLVEYIIETQIKKQIPLFFRVEQWNGFYTSAMQVMKILFANNLNHAIRLMNLFFKKTTDNKERHYNYLEKYDDVVITFLSSIQGVSYNTGKLVKDSLELESLNDLLELNEEKLTSIKGIGHKTSDKILGAIK
jgi:ERCC4-type nuclease